jgi:hypothetical protein
MSATVTAVTPAGVRAELEELLRLAQAVMSAEARLETYAERMWEREGDLFHDRMGAAGFRGNLLYVVMDAVRSAVKDVMNDHGCADIFGAEKAQAVQDALDVFLFAASRDGLDEDWSEAVAS